MLIVSSFLILCALSLTRGRPASRLGPAENAGRRGVGSRCAAWARAGPAGRLYRWWLAKLAPTPNPLDTAADLELFVACLSAGLSPARAAAAVATTSSCAAWRSTASLLSLGVDADRAWRELAQAPGLGELAALARSLTNKLMHAPSVQLKKLSAEGRVDALTLAQELFALDEGLDKT